VRRTFLEHRLNEADGGTPRAPASGGAGRSETWRFEFEAKRRRFAILYVDNWNCWALEN
jgi:hypothetical protein